MGKLLTYDDVCLVPRFSECASRSECDASTEFLGFRFKLPVMAANMKAVIDEDWARFFSENGYMYSMHRFDIDIQKFIENCTKDPEFISFLHRNRTNLPLGSI